MTIRQQFKRTLHVYKMNSVVNFEAGSAKVVDGPWVRIDILETDQTFEGPTYPAALQKYVEEAEREEKYNAQFPRIYHD